MQTITISLCARGYKPPSSSGYSPQGLVFKTQTPLGYDGNVLRLSHCPGMEESQEG